MIKALIPLILYTHTCRFARKLEHADWKATNGFFHRFCTRYGVLSKKICGESLDCPDYTNFVEQTLAPLLMEYEPRDIYNADETSLFGKALPTKTYAFRGEDVKGKKLSKDRLTLMLCTNMNGTDKLRPLLIGKSKKPQCLARKGLGLSDLKVDYYSNSNGWMTSVIFEHWLMKWNERLAREKRKVLLLIDNAPSHITNTMSNIRIQFLPPNTTSKLQPLDQGVIRSVKCHYRRLLAEMYLAGITNNEDATQVMKSIDFVVVHDTILKAWQMVTTTVIENCFHKAGFSTSVSPAPEPEPAPSRNLWDDIQTALGVRVDFAEYATHDDRIETGNHMTDDEIVAEVQKDTARLERGENGEVDLTDGDDADDDSDTESLSSSASSDTDIIHTSTQFLSIVGQQRAYLMRNKLPKEAFDALSALEMYIVEAKLTVCNRQSNLTSYFKSQSR